MKRKPDLRIVANWTVAKETSPLWHQLWQRLLAPEGEETAPQQLRTEAAHVDMDREAEDWK